MTFDDITVHGGRVTGGMLRLDTKLYLVLGKAAHVHVGGFDFVAGCANVIDPCLAAAARRRLCDFEIERTGKHR